MTPATGRPGWTARLRLQRVVGLAQGLVEGAERPPHAGLADVRGVHRPAGQVLVNDLGAEVQDPRAAGAGVGALLTANPGADLALKLAGSAYLLVLAWRIGRSQGGERTAVARPLGLLAGAAFQFANPKAWLFALAAMGPSSRRTCRRLSRP